MLKAAVLGSPIAHTLSPVLHRAGYAALGLMDWSYAAHEVRESELVEFVDALDSSWRGLSLTMPLKGVAVEVAGEVSGVAARTRSINTLVRRDDEWLADNTDVAGIVAALAGAEHDGTATVLGAGATARSSVEALRILGVRRVRVAARRPEAAASVGGPGGPDIVAVPLSQWARETGGIVISALPPAGGAAAAAALDRPCTGALLDVVYAGWPTPLARAASNAGMRAVSGLDMLVHQAARQFELFTGHPAPVPAMMAAGLAAVGQG